MTLQEIIDLYYNSIKTQNEILGMLKHYALTMKPNHEIIVDANNNIIRFVNPKVERKEKIENVPTPKPKEQEQMKINGKTIFRNKNAKTWYTRYRQDGKQFYISGKTQQEVAEKLKEALNIEKRKKVIGITLNQWYEKWLHLYKIGKVKQATIEDYEKNFIHISDKIWNKNIKQITTAEILETLNAIKKERAKQKVYEFLKALFDKALIHKHIKENIMLLIEKPKHKKSKGVALNKEQQLEFLKLCETTRFGNLYKTILFQGLRLGEALGITFNNIDFKNKTLTIEKTINNKNQFDTTKTEQSHRTMPLFNPTYELLRNIKVNNENERIFNFKYSSPKSNISDIIEKSNLPKFSLHDLRHTFITNCQNENIPEHVIQSWVGHEIGSKVTKSVYTHLTQDVNLLNINKLNNTEFYSNSTHK